MTFTSPAPAPSRMREERLGKPRMNRLTVAVTLRTQEITAVYWNKHYKVSYKEKINKKKKRKETISLRISGELGFERIDELETE